GSDDPGDSGAPVLAGDALDELERVEREEACVVGKAEEVESLEEEFEAAGVAGSGGCGAIPLVREENQDALRHGFTYLRMKHGAGCDIPSPPRQSVTGRG